MDNCIWKYDIWNHIEVMDKLQLCILKQIRPRSSGKTDSLSLFWERTAKSEWWKELPLSKQNYLFWSWEKFQDSTEALNTCKNLHLLNECIYFLSEWCWSIFMLTFNCNNSYGHSASIKTNHNIEHQLQTLWIEGLIMGPLKAVKHVSYCISGTSKADALT